jgi:hypothetical protein
MIFGKIGHRFWACIDVMHAREKNIQLYGLLEGVSKWRNPVCCKVMQRGFHA